MNVFLYVCMYACLRYCLCVCIFMSLAYLLPLFVGCDVFYLSLLTTHFVCICCRCLDRLVFVGSVFRDVWIWSADENPAMLDLRQTMSRLKH